MNSGWKNSFVGKFNFRRLFRSTLIISVLLYFFVMIFAHTLADQIIFQPQSAFYRDDDSILKLATESGEKISATYLKNPEAEFTILFSHGNAEDIGTAATFLSELQNAGFSVFAYDYRGYGTSEGKPSEQNSYQDIEAAYNYLTGELKIPAEKIILLGRSLGGAVSIDLAARKPCGGLIAESTFVSAFRVMTKHKIFPFDKFDSLSKIENVKCPVLVIHGKKDTLIPFWHGEMLLERANEPKFSFWIEEANHNNVFAISRNDYLREIKRFSDKLSK